MREAARPSPSNQARVISETLTLAQRENFRVNVIEAFDQPWKRALEGSTGALLGHFRSRDAGAEIQFRRRSSPIIRDWLSRPRAGILVAAFAFAGAWLFGPRQKRAAAYCGEGSRRSRSCRACCSAGRLRRSRSTVSASAAGCGCSPYAAIAALAPIVCAAACAAGRALPAFAALLGRPGDIRDGLELALGACFHRADLAFGGDRARPGVRSALSRYPVCAAKRSRFCLPGSDGLDAASGRDARRPRRRLPPPCSRSRPSTSRSTRHSPIGRRSGLPPA